MITNRPFKTTALALLFLAFAANAHGAITGLSDAPLVTSSTTSVLPNLMFVLDDSGSMGWTHMPDDAVNFAGKYGYASNQCNGVYYEPTITYSPPVDSTGAPLNATATSFTAAYTNGYSTGAGTVNLSTSFLDTGFFSPTDASGFASQAAFYYQYSGTQTTAALKKYYDTASTFYTECNTSPGVIAGSGSNVFTKVSLSSTAAATTATIVVSGTSSTSVSSIKVNGTQEIMSGTAAASTASSTVASNIATQINLCTSAKVGNCSTTGGHGYTASTSGGSTVTLTGLAATATTLIITKGNSGTMTLAPTIFPIADATKLQNFANWYSYYRARMLMMKTASGRAFAPVDDKYRVGFMTINNNVSPDILNFAPFDAAQKSLWYNKLYTSNPANSTPLREALANVGRIYAHKLTSLYGTTINDPMQYSCQQNFTILSTDGFWRSGDNAVQLNGTTAIGQQDGAEPRPYNDGAAQMLTTVQVQQALTQIFQSTSQLQSRTLQIQSSTSDLQQRTGALQWTTKLQKTTAPLQWQTKLQKTTAPLQWQTKQQIQTGALQWTTKQQKITSALTWQTKQQVQAGALQWTTKQQKITSALTWQTNLQKATGALRWTTKQQKITAPLMWKTNLQIATGALQWQTKLQQTTAALQWQTKSQKTTAPLLRSTATYTSTVYRLTVSTTLAGTYSNASTNTTYNCITSGTGSGTNMYCKLGALQTAGTGLASCTVTANGSPPTGAATTDGSRNVIVACAQSGWGTATAVGANGTCNASPTVQCSTGAVTTGYVATYPGTSCSINFNSGGANTADASGNVVTACPTSGTWSTAANIGANTTCTPSATIQCPASATTTTSYLPSPGATCSVNWTSASAASTSNASGNVVTACPTSGTWSTAANVGANATCAGDGTTVQCSNTGVASYVATYPPACTSTFNGVAASSTADGSGNVTACSNTGATYSGATTVAAGGTCNGALANVQCSTGTAAAAAYVTTYPGTCAVNWNGAAASSTADASSNVITSCPVNAAFNPTLTSVGAGGTCDGTVANIQCSNAGTAAYVTYASPGCTATFNASGTSTADGSGNVISCPNTGATYSTATSLTAGQTCTGGGNIQCGITGSSAAAYVTTYPGTCTLTYNGATGTSTADGTGKVTTCPVNAAFNATLTSVGAGGTCDGTLANIQCSNAGTAAYTTYASPNCTATFNGAGTSTADGSGNVTSCPVNAAYSTATSLTAGQTCTGGGNIQCGITGSSAAAYVTTYPGTCTLTYNGAAATSTADGTGKVTTCPVNAAFNPTLTSVGAGGTCDGTLANIQCSNAGTAAYTTYASPNCTATFNAAGSSTANGSGNVTSCPVNAAYSTAVTVGAGNICNGALANVQCSAGTATTAYVATYPPTCATTFNAAGSSTADASGNVITACPVNAAWNTAAAVAAGGTCDGTLSNVQCSAGTAATAYVTSYPPTCATTFSAAGSSTADASGNVITACPVNAAFNPTWTDVAGGGTCTPSANANCQYNWGGWSNANTCTTNLSSGAGAWNITSGTDCQYTSYTAYANANSCTAAPQDATNPFDMTATSGRATQCRTLYNGSTTDNGYVGASACTPGVTGGQTVTCQTITTGPTPVLSCTAAAAVAGNSYTQTTCSPPTTVPGTPTGVASGVASCTPGTGPGPAFITTSCNTVTVGPTGAGTCTPTAADVSNNYTTTTCASGAGGVPDTLADVAEYYYITDLRTDALGNCTGAVVAPATVGNTLCTAGAVASAFADATLTVSAPASPTSTIVNSITVGSTTITSAATSGSTTASTVASRIAAKISLAGYSATASGSTVTITGPASAGGSVPVISQSGNLTITPTAFTAHAASIDPLNNVPSTGLDAASHQHMTTFTLGLGARGRMVYSPTYLTDTSGDFFSIKNGSTANGTTICPWQTSGACNWPVPGDNQIENVDDLWHAAVNGRGSYFSATDPASLATSLGSALAGVSARTGASAAATTSNPNVTSGDNFVFSSTFTTNSWDGELVRQQLDLTTGATSSTVDWAAQAKLDTKAALTPKAASRTIYTWSASASDHLQAFNETNFGANANFNTPYISTSPDGLTQLLCASASICAPQTIPAAWQASHAYIAGDQYTNSNIFYLVSAGYTSGATFPLAWQASHAYIAGDQYINSSTLYRVVSGYTSGAAFGATDTANSSVLATATGRAGDNLVNFLRGDRTNEGAETDNTKYYRQRTHILGDIVNAEAVYVKASLFNYNDAGYGAFVTANTSRQGIVYAAANDGMLHAFYSADGGAGIVGGDEAWAYIPSLMLPDLYKLADKEYATQHRYFVDGTPVVGDICPTAPATDCTATPGSGLPNEWRTILVGGFNKGGRGYYALDITDPASPKALWEFTDTNLGYTYGNPKITKLKDGTWVVLVTSGYNNVPGTPTASYGGDGVGRLYVLNASTGAIIRSISTGVGNTTTPSGLARIAVRVTDSSTDDTALAVYGGDTLGKLWRFDVNNDIGAAGYDAQLLTTLIGPTGVAQPITAKPELGKVSNTHEVVYVGTGSYLGVGDLGDTNKQSIYAIEDPLAAGTVASTAIYANPRTLTTFINQTPVSTTCPVNSPSTICTAGQTVRTSPNLAVNFASDDGWFMDLPDTGERANTDPTLSLGTLGFTTNVPNSNACTVGGYSYRYFMDYRTGGAVSTSTTAVVSTKLGNALATRPVYVRLPNGVVVELTRLSTGTTSTSQVPIGAGGAATRRTSWRELIQEQ